MLSRRTLMYMVILIFTATTQAFAGTKVELTDYDLDEVNAGGIVKDTTVHFISPDFVFLAAPKIKSFSTDINGGVSVGVNGSAVPFATTKPSGQTTVPLAVISRSTNVGGLIQTSNNQILKVTTSSPFLAFTYRP